MGFSMTPIQLPFTKTFEHSAKYSFLQLDITFSNVYFFNHVIIGVDEKLLVICVVRDKCL